MKQGLRCRPEACHSKLDCGCRSSPKPLQSLTLAVTLFFWACAGMAQTQPSARAMQVRPP
jgi:hypothetical protein